jgi:hypothetical protein
VPDENCGSVLTDVAERAEKIVPVKHGVIVVEPALKRINLWPHCTFCYRRHRCCPSTLQRQNDRRALDNTTCDQVAADQGKGQARDRESISV